MNFCHCCKLYDPGKQSSLPQALRLTNHPKRQHQLQALLHQCKLCQRRLTCSLRRQSLRNSRGNRRRLLHLRKGRELVEVQHKRRALGYFLATTDAFATLPYSNATDPVLPKLLNQAIEFAKALPPDAKAIDSKETARVCSALSSVINDIQAGTRVSLPDIQLLCKVIKLGGLSQQDSHEAFVKLTDSVRSVLKSAAEVHSNA